MSRANLIYRYCLALSMIGLSTRVVAQDTVAITLVQAIERANMRSLDALVARNIYRSSYWEYRTYRAEMLPELGLVASMPNYSKSYSQYQNPDGSYGYVGNDFSRLDGGLSITQNVPLTGGVLSVNSSLQRLQQYGHNGSKSFMSVPISITLNQPLFGFNRVKWLQRIEPVKFKEAQQRLVSQIEYVSSQTVDYYFSLLLGQINMDIAQQNYTNSMRLYKIAEARRELEVISENELRQMRVAMLNAEGYLWQARSSLNSSMFQLRSFLDYDDQVVLKTSLPEPFFGTMPILCYDDVLMLAKENNSFTHNIRRRLLESSREVSRAKSNRWSADMFLSFGVSGKDATLPLAYDGGSLRPNQMVNLGISIPILDWGKSKGRVMLAEANSEVETSRIEREVLEFDQSIYLRVENFNNQSRQLSIAQETDILALKRYETMVEAFASDNKIDILSLNDSQASKDAARRDYIEQMYRLWSYHYQIRALTLYDFVEGQGLRVDYDEIVK